MARNRTRLPWIRGGSAAGRDASFFEDETGRRSRPASQAYFFSPVEEAQSHARWNRALLREKFRGPLSGTEQAAFGISAAAVAALADVGGEPRREEEFDDRHDTAIASNVPLPPIKDGKAAALGQGEKATPKGAHPYHPFLETVGDDPFSNPVSNRADAGGSGRRMAARGSGAPLETRMPGAERTADAAAVRKADSAPGEARAPGAPDTAPVIRGPAEANAVGVAAAAGIEGLPEEAREQVNGAAARGATAAKAEAGRIPAEGGAGAKPKDAPPATEAKAKPEERRIAVEEARGAEQAENLPASVAEAKAEAGRSAEAPAGRAKTKDAAVEDIECGAERAAAEEEAGQAKAKDVPVAASTDSGLDTKPAKTIAPAKDVEVVKAEPASRPADAVAAGAKPKDPPPVVETKVDAGRDHSEAMEQTQARFASAAVVADVVPGFGAGGASGRAKADEPTVAAKLDGAKALAAGTAAEAKASDAAVAAKLDGGKAPADAPIAHAKASETAANNAKAAAQHAGSADTPVSHAKAADIGASATKTTQSTGPTDAPSAHAKAAEVAANGAKASAGGHGPATDALSAPAKAADGAATTGAKAAAQPPGSADTPAGPAKGVDGASSAAKAKTDHDAPATDAASQQLKAKDVAGTGAKADAVQDQPQAPGQAKLVPAVVETKAGHILGPVEAPSETKGKHAAAAEAKASDPARDAKDAVGQATEIAGADGRADAVKPPDPVKIVPTLGEAKAEQVKPPADAVGDAKAKDVAVPVVETKVGTGQHLADAALQQGKAKDAPAVVVVEAKAEQDKALAASPEDAKTKDTAVAVLESRSEALDGSAGKTAPAKVVPAVVEVKAVDSHSLAEAAEPAKKGEILAEAKTDLSPRMHEAPVEKAKEPPVAADAKAEGGDHPVAAIDQTKAKDVAAVIEAEPEPIRVSAKTAAEDDHGGAAAGGGALAGGPAADAINLRVDDFWSADGGGSRKIETYTLPAENAAPTAPQTAALAVVAPTREVATQSEPTLAFKFVGEKGGTAEAIRATPAGTERATATDEPTARGEAKTGQVPSSDITPDDAADGLLPGHVAMPGEESGEALALGQALAPFARPPSEGGSAPRAEHVPDTPALDFPLHLPPSDLVIF